MKRILLILLTISLIALGAGCSVVSSKGGNLPQDDNNGGETSSAAPDHGSSLETPSNIEIEEIVREVLGEMLFRELSLETISVVKSASAKAVSVGFDAKVGQISGDFSVGSGSGSALINFEGTVEEITSDGAAGPVYYYSPLYVNITLDSYSFDSEVLGTTTVEGAIACFFQGRFAEPTTKLIGNGNCNIGSTDDSDHLTITFDGNTHQVNYDVTYKVYGHPFDFESYEYSGAFTIDGMDINLEEMIQ